MMAQREAWVSGRTQKSLSLAPVMSMPFSIILLILLMISTLRLRLPQISRMMASVRFLPCSCCTSSTSDSTTRQIFIRSDTQHLTLLPAATLQKTKQRRSRSGSFLSSFWTRFFTAGLVMKNSILSRRSCRSSTLWRGCFIQRLRVRVPKLVLHWLKMSQRVVLAARVFRSISFEKIWMALIVDLSNIMLERELTSRSSNCPLLHPSRSSPTHSSSFSSACLIFTLSSSLLYMLYAFFSRNPIATCTSPLPSFSSQIFAENSENFSRTFLRSLLRGGMMAMTSKRDSASLGLVWMSRDSRQVQCSLSGKAPIVKRRAVLLCVAKVTSLSTPLSSMLMKIVTALRSTSSYSYIMINLIPALGPKSNLPTEMQNSPVGIKCRCISG